MQDRASVAVVLSAIVLAFGQPLRAQCDGIRPVAELRGLSRSAGAAVVHDPDGAGPLPSWLVVGGEFDIAGGIFAKNIAAWDGSSWSSLGAGIEPGNAGPIAFTDITEFDFDGPGPLGPQIVVGGVLGISNGVRLNGVGRWNGTAWERLGGFGGTNVAYPLAFEAFDPDGDGPLGTCLIAGGPFTLADLQSSIRYLAYWHDGGWHALSPNGIGNRVNDMVVADLDGDGPIPRMLYIVGRMLSVNGVSGYNYVAGWDGTTWHALGNGLSGWGESVVVYDADGPGGTNALLVVGGDFAAAGGVPAQRVAAWDGAAWRAMGDGFDRVPSLDVTDVEPGAPPTLLATGSFLASGGTPVRAVARWDGAAWVQFPWNLDLSSPFAFADADPDGDGPQPRRTVALGQFGTSDAFEPTAVGYFDGAAWRSFGHGITGITAAACRDPSNGDLYVGGAFQLMQHGAEVRDIGRWADGTLSGLGADVDGSIATMTFADLDGSDLTPDQLVIGGSFLSVSGTPARCVATWDGASWHALGEGFNGSVLALATYDEDGPGGPLRPQLYAAGTFSMSGATVANRLARWDGEQWRQVGSGLSARAQALCAFDADADGPALPQLIVGGTFTTAGGLSCSGITAWNGTSFAPLGAGVASANVLSLGLFDFDHDGPEHASLVVGGGFSTAGGVAAHRVAAWNGSTWRSLGASGLTDGLSISSFDRDGSGPIERWLIVGGKDRLQAYDGASWSTLASATNRNFLFAAEVVDTGPTPRPALLIGGTFSQVTSSVAPAIAVWSPPAIITIHDHPGDLRVILASDASFDAAATIDSGEELQYQWRRNGLDLADGATPWGSTIQGATTASLVIQDAQPQDAATYDCRVQTDCVSALSEPAALLVALCSADFDSNLVLDSRDFFAFLVAFFEAAEGADFNEDGAANSQDFFDFLAAFFAGC